MPRKLTIDSLKFEAGRFARRESRHHESSLFGVTDGKAIGTYLEHKFQQVLHARYIFLEGSSAAGIDFPELHVDMKTTSIKQPQSSCPFRSARQKIYGLGYSLLVFVYEKSDDMTTETSRLTIQHAIYVDKSRTADYQTTKGLQGILDNGANLDDVVAFFDDRMLPVEEIAARALAEEVLENPPQVGYLTISNALQWRLQYGRSIREAGNVQGIEAL